MRSLRLSAALCSNALFSILVASTAAFAQMDRTSAPAAKPLIELAPSATPVVRKAGEASFENPPANFHAFASVHAGDVAVAEPLTLKFNVSTQITRIDLTKDFAIDAGSTCQVGNRYSKGDSCILQVRFTPQGAGRRLGKVTITHTASPQPLNVGLGGNGYAPVLSFTPALITTVPGTYPSSKGLLSGALNLAVDGGDVLYIDDIGNDLLREVDSSGMTNVSPFFAPPASVAVDNFGDAWTVNIAGSTYYFGNYSPFRVQTAWSTSYAPGSCTPSAQCSILTVGMNGPAEINIDSDNNLIMEEETEGALEMPVGTWGSGDQTLNLWYLNDVYAYFFGPSNTFAADANDNLYTAISYTPESDCAIVMESLYGAEGSNPIFTRVAGADNCGFSGDGGQARDAEIGGSIGQIAFDIAGNLYFSDTSNQRVRRIDASTGQINTIAGDGIAGYTGDNAQATTAELSSPTGVTVDSQGQVYIISSAATGQVVRKLGPNGIINFGDQVKSTAGSAHLVTVANTGNDSMVLTGATITGTNPGDFKIDPTTTSCILTEGSTLYSGQSCKVGVIFTPAALNSRTANLVFLNNTVTNMNTVQLSGFGVLPAPKFSITAPANNATETSGTAFTFSVSVTSSSGPQPTGTVTMLLNGTAVTGSPATLNGSGVASLSVTSTKTGSNTLSATYNGDSNYSAAGPNTHTITVNAPALKKQAKVALASSANPATACNAISFTVTVTGTGSEVPTGTVKLMNGAALLSEASLHDGSALLPNLRLVSGTNQLTASYSGDSAYESATSSPLKQLVSGNVSCGSGSGTDHPLANPGDLRAR